MRRGKLYHARWQLGIAFFFILAPFLFFGFVADIGHIGVSRLFLELASSAIRLLIAYGIAAILAWVCAVSFYRGNIGAIILPLFDVLQSFPTFAALPLATYLWGRTDVTVIVFLVLTVIWPILFSTLSNLRLMKGDWEESAEIVGLKGFDYVRFFLFPVSMPGFVTGSIIGLGEGWEALVATEIIVNIPTGLGSFFQSFSHNSTITAFGILAFLLFIFSMNKLIWIPLLDWSHRLMEE